MSENLGDLLRKKKEEHDAWVKKQAEDAEIERLAEIQRHFEAAKKYLEEMREKIPADVKNGYGWESKHNGITYVISNGYDSRRRLNSGPGQYVTRYKTGEYDYRYVLYNTEIWDEFVEWGKTLGLDISIHEEGHSESRGDDGWWEHDYYYMLIKAL
jgi:hypothetical protein